MFLGQCSLRCLQDTRHAVRVIWTKKKSTLCNPVERERELEKATS